MFWLNYVVGTFEHPKHMFKFIGKKIISFQFNPEIVHSWTNVLILKVFYIDNTLAGLQIRGGKGYFSIDFLEFSIEN